MHVPLNHALSQLLTLSLRLITKHFEQYCEGITRNTGVNCSWIIDNATEFLKKTLRSECKEGARHFNSFNFSTFYTNIPHDLLLDSISQLISEAYKIRGAKYLVVQSDSTAYLVEHNVCTRP